MNPAGEAEVIPRVTAEEITSYHLQAVETYCEVAEGRGWRHSEMLDVRDLLRSIVSGKAVVVPREEVERIAKACRDFSGMSPLVAQIFAATTRWLPPAAPPVSPSEPPRACGEDCGRCSGEYCENHATEPCDCDVIDRHAAAPLPTETAPKHWYEGTHENVYPDSLRPQGEPETIMDVAFEIGISAIRARITELERELAESRKPFPCGVCSGQPLKSGRPCICGGAGTEAEEMAGLRRELYDSANREEKLEDENARLSSRLAELTGVVEAAEQHVRILQKNIEALNPSRLHSELAAAASPVETPENGEPQ